MQRHSAPALVSIVMGSQSDYKIMQGAKETLELLQVPHEVLVVSAHRTPQRLAEYGESVCNRGIKVVIAGAGGAAHLPGMVAAYTTLPVLGVPIDATSLKGMDSLHSIVQMPFGVPVATFAIGLAGAKNAALFSAQLLALQDGKIHQKVQEFRQKQTEEVPLTPDQQLA